MADVASLLVSRADLRRRVAELGRTITEDYEGREPVLISVLKGGVMFLADLMRAVDLGLEPHLMAISRYGDAGGSRGRVRILLDVDVDLTDRHVIVVEDIVDTGLTLRYLLQVLTARGPSSLEVCTLLDKTARRIVPMAPRYVGFECPDRFVVGYGLDLAERYRNLPDIVQVHDVAALQADPDALLPWLPAPEA